MSSGRCLCGAVVFEVSEPFVTSSICHCTTCKKLSGGVGTTNGRARSDAINVVAGLELTDVAFAARLRREPGLRDAVESWLAGTDTALPAWVEWEQRKHERLLAA